MVYFAGGEYPPWDGRPLNGDGDVGFVGGVRPLNGDGDDVGLVAGVSAAFDCLYFSALALLARCFLYSSSCFACS